MFEKYKTKLILLSLFAFNKCLLATFTVEFQAGNFSDRSGIALTDGSLGVLVADTNGSGFSGLSDGSSDLNGSFLSVGNSLGLTNVLILGIVGASDIGQGNGTFASTFSLDYSGDFSEGDDLGFYWFPTINSQGSIISEGTDYGFYSSSNVESDAGSTISFTSDLPDGGTYTLATFDSTIVNTGPSPTSFQAQFTSFVPEPSTYALIAGFLILGYVVIRRKS